MKAMEAKVYEEGVLILKQENIFFYAKKISLLINRALKICMFGGLRMKSSEKNFKNSSQTPF